MAEAEPKLKINQVIRVPNKLTYGEVTLRLRALSVYRPSGVFPYIDRLRCIFVDPGRSRLIVASNKITDDPFESLVLTADTDVNFTYLNPKTSELTTFNLPMLLALVRSACQFTL